MRLAKEPHAHSLASRGCRRAPRVPPPVCLPAGHQARPRSPGLQRPCSRWRCPMMAVTSPVASPALPPPGLAIGKKQDRFKSFCQDLDAVKEKALARVGEADVAYVRNLNRFSRAMEVVGRAL